MDPTILVVSIIGAALTTGLIYYSLRTVFLFKSNVAARAWVYISLSAIFFGVGVVAFLIESLVPLGLLPVGASVGDCGCVISPPWFEKELSFLGQQRSFRLTDPLPFATLR